MSANRAREVENEDFLVPAPLFRYGPWALMLVGTALSLSVLLAALWRIEVSRHGEYVKAFQLAAAGEAAVRATTSQLFALLRQSVASIQAAQTAESADPARNRDRQLQASLQMADPRILAIAIARDGRLHATQSQGLHEAAILRSKLGALQRAEVGVPVVMPTLSVGTPPMQVLPVAFRLAEPGPLVGVLYLVDLEIVASVFRDVLAERSGWLRIDNLSARKLLELHHDLSADRTSDRAIADAASAPEQAMQRSVDYGSERLLVVRRAVDYAPLVVTVGLVEADVLMELHHRVTATWAIFAVSMLVVMSLVSVTSLALRKFGVKEAHLRRLATVDILTGLPNRRSFHHLLQRAIATAMRRQQVFGLMFVDLDNFKDINDSLGHDAGDQLLRGAGGVLSNAVRQGDIVCRLGGDEFTILLNDLRNADEARAVGQRILDRLAEPLRVGDVEVRTRATIGIALLPQHATTASDLMRFADTAMYRAKQDGKSICLIYDDSMAVQALHKAERARELSQAIARDELFLEYQPKFCLRTGRVTGHEALVRWRHPRLGLVGPGEFIGLAEESGLIVDLGLWVLRRAVRQLRAWHDQGAGWQHVAINVSALQLRSGRFPECVDEALVQHGVPGAHLQIELTESSLVLDAEVARALVRRAHARGGSVAVDDFGTGYSSLAALQQFNIDFLKIDRAFVRSIDSHSGEQICRTVVSLAHGLKMRAVAEGVETEAQRDALRRLGCDEAQGFLYARPLAADEVLRRALLLMPVEEPIDAPRLPAPAIV
jgi:diguanylate cyclase (GGDEF)-like protein